jgi:hypothetical protein
LIGDDQHRHHDRGKVGVEYGFATGVLTRHRRGQHQARHPAGETGSGVGRAGRPSAGADKSDGCAGSGAGEGDGAADSIRIGLGLPLSVEGGVIGRTEDLNRETLRQPQRPSPQQEIARIAVDRAGIGDLNGSVSAGTYFICA